MQTYKFVVKYMDGTHRIDCCTIPSNLNPNWPGAWKKMLRRLERDKEFAELKSVMAICNKGNGSAKVEDY